MAIFFAPALAIYRNYIVSMQQHAREVNRQTVERTELEFRWWRCGVARLCLFRWHELICVLTCHHSYASAICWIVFVCWLFGLSPMCGVSAKKNLSLIYYNYHYS